VVGSLTPPVYTVNYTLKMEMLFSSLNGLYLSGDKNVERYADYHGCLMQQVYGNIP
jgi:hypothetical protein